MLQKACRGAGTLQGFIVNDQHITAERLQYNNEGIDRRWPFSEPAFWPIDYDTYWSTFLLQL